MFDPNLPRGGDQTIPRPAVFEFSRRAPWADTSHLTTWDAASVLDVVRGVEPRAARPRQMDVELRAAAVLCGITDTDRGASVILTKRSSSMRTHSGEISFPGGRLDEGETSLEGALRESHEEIGLLPHLVTPVGELNHVFTVVSASYVVPIVAHVAEHEHLVPMTDEVAKVLYVPVSELLHPDAFREEMWTFPHATVGVTFFEIPGETIYGATARMLFHLAALLTGTVEQM